MNADTFPHESDASALLAALVTTIPAADPAAPAAPDVPVTVIQSQVDHVAGTVNATVTDANGTTYRITVEVLEQAAPVVAPIAEPPVQAAT